MDFGRQRGFLLDGEDLPEKVGCRKESYFLEFMYVDVARDFVGVAFHVLLDGAKSSHNNRDCFVLSPNIRSTSISKSLYLVSFSVVLTKVLVSRGVVMSMRRQVLSFLFFSTMSSLLAAMVLSVWMGMSHRIVTLSFSVTVLGSCSYHRSFTSMPNSLQIIQCVCAAALLRRRMYSVLASQGSQRPGGQGLIETATQSTFWVYVRLLEDVMLVPACWEALILGCDDKALGYFLEATCF